MNIGPFLSEEILNGEGGETPRAEGSQLRGGVEGKIMLDTISGPRSIALIPMQHEKRRSSFSLLSEDGKENQSFFGNEEELVSKSCVEVDDGEDGEGEGGRGQEPFDLQEDWINTGFPDNCNSGSEDPDRGEGEGEGGSLVSVSEESNEESEILTSSVHPADSTDSCDGKAGAGTEAGAVSSGWYFATRETVRQQEFHQPSLKSNLEVFKRSAMLVALVKGAK